MIKLQTKRRSYYSSLSSSSIFRRLHDFFGLDLFRLRSSSTISLSSLIFTPDAPREGILIGSSINSIIAGGEAVKSSGSWSCWCRRLPTPITVRSIFDLSSWTLSLNIDRQMIDSIARNLMESFVCLQIQCPAWPHQRSTARSDSVEELLTLSGGWNSQELANTILLRFHVSPHGCV